MTLGSSNKPQAAVIGSNSMVGSRFCELAASKIDLLKADLKSSIAVDITSLQSLNSFFENYQFKYLVLFSAFTDVDEAEKQRGDKKASCWRINVEGVRNITNLCRDYHIKLIFISTDYVFDGEKGPYSESDNTALSPNKISWYAKTKLEAEKIIEENLKDYIILRISYPYRAKFNNKEDFARSIVRRYHANDAYGYFTDQFITPTLIDDLEEAIRLLVKKKQLGIFHLASPKLTTPYHFAKKLISDLGLDSKKLRQASIIDYLKSQNVPPRPIKGGLKVAKITKLGFTPTTWQQGITKITTQSKGQLI